MSLHERDVRELRRLIRKVDTLGGVGVVNTHTAITIGPPATSSPGRRSRKPVAFDLVRLPQGTNASSPAGKYFGYVQQRKSGTTFSVSGDLDLSDLYEDTATLAMCLNVLDSGGTALSIASSIDTYQICLDTGETATFTSGQTTTTYKVFLMLGLSFGC